MEQDILRTLLNIVEQGGRLAQDMIQNSEPSLKADRSVLTKADQAVSALTRTALQPFLETGSHVLIDEEDVNSQDLFQQVMSGSFEYVWSIDPIDGTRAYSNRMPVYGISLGVMKASRPWMGAVFFPALEELFYCDGKDSFFVAGAFSSPAGPQKIVPLDQTITPQAIFLASDRFMRRYRWDPQVCQMMMPTVAVVELCWPAIGRGCGSYFEANLWDYAGSWPVFRSAGLDLRSCRTGKILDHLCPDAFWGTGAKTWRLKEDYILSSARNYPIIKKNMPPFPSWLKSLSKVMPS